MEALEISSDFRHSISIDEDIGDIVLSKFSKSTKEDHQHLCAVVGGMAQALKDQNQKLTPTTYFGATIMSLNRISLELNPSDHVVTALLTFLSIVLPKVKVGELRKWRESVEEPILRIIRLESMSVGVVVNGLKCVGHLIVISDKANWSNVSLLYQVFVSFICDARQKVRKQSHMSLRDVLQSFQRSALLAPASDGITSIFERFLLLAGGSKTAESGRAKGAEEVLFILDALKDCLPLMSTNAISSILKYFESLLKLRQPVVTRRITDSLHVLCLSPTSEVAPKMLRDLLCSLAESVSQNEKSVDSMTFTARLLDVGTRKVYSLNRDVCVARLHIVFHALGEILATEHEEAVFAAMEAFRSLISACIDRGLIKQEFEHIGDDEGGTIIERLCATIESLLEYRYNAVWEISLKIVATMFDKLGEFSYQLLRGAVKNLANMQKMSDDTLQCRKQLHECFGSVLGAMGPKLFLTLLPLNLEAQDPSEVNCWLFTILKQYTVGASLSFYRKSILSKIGSIRQKSEKLEQEGRMFSAKTAEGLVYSIWSLLPAFCNYPLDAASSFEDLKGQLCETLLNEPEIRGIVCSSLQILIQQNKRSLEENSDLLNDEMSIPVQRARAYYTPQVATENLNILKSSADDLLENLFVSFTKSSNDNGGCLQTTISQFASISEKKVVGKWFRRAMKDLLDVMKEAAKEKQPNSMVVEKSDKGIPLLQQRARLLDFAVSLLSGLSSKEVNTLYSAIKPALEDDEGLIQKKSYKVLSYILKDACDFLTDNLDDLLRTMIKVLPSCHFSAKRHRIDCLYFIIVHMSKNVSEQNRKDIVGSFLTEIILALKESNKKTRNKAFDILVQIGHAFGDEDQGGKKENLLQYFNMVAGGLAGETPHMISAAVKGLARLAYEFTDLVSAVYNVLPSAFLLLQRKNREIIKANLGLLKVLVAKSEAEGLEIHLKSLVEGLLKWQDNTKNHFKAKVKLLLEMLVRKCGMDAVKAVMPEEHMKLLTNIRKIKERKERKAASGESEAETRTVHSKATTRMSRWNYTKVFSDFGDEGSEEDEYMDTKHTKASAKSKHNNIRRAAKSLPEDTYDELEEDPLDFLDQQKIRSVLQSSGKSLKRKQEDSDDEEMQIDSEGRLVIREGERKKRDKPSNDSEQLDSKSRAGSSRAGSMKSTGKKRQKLGKETGWAYTGNEYASKKASGDVTRKDKLEPYAYWPLDRKMMSKRPEHRAAARKGMASVVKMTKNMQGKSVATALAMKTKFKRKQKKHGKKSV
ncbi:hypothetical protein ACHQM5_030046 [Ranunculus cassubicifolius]